MAFCYDLKIAVWMGTSIMKTIGLLGGMSWESTLVYYRELNQAIKHHLGGLHSAKMMMVNVDFAPIENWMCEGRWDLIAENLIEHGLTIQTAGADFLVISTNTMHKLAPQIESAIDIPLLHIADAVGREVTALGHQKVGLLGTAFTMEHDFYAQRLKRYDVDVLIPDQTARDVVNQIIFDELCLGTFKAASKQRYLEIIDHLSAAGAQAVILGCTEIGLLINQTDTDTPLIDATFSHINAVVKHALA